MNINKGDTPDTTPGTKYERKKLLAPTKQEQNEEEDSQIQNGRRKCQ